MLATSSEDGLVEFIPSVAMARVLADHKTIQRYFAIHNADPSGNLKSPASPPSTTSRHCRWLHNYNSLVPLHDLNTAVFVFHGGDSIF